MPELAIGVWIKRLSPSTTARNIMPGITGRVGGLDPSQHNNPSEFNGYNYFPVEWSNGLWSSLAPEDEGSVWEFA